MTANEMAALDQRLDGFLGDLLAPMGRSERRHWAKVYLQGLLLDGERKSIEPIAAKIPGADVQALRQFVGQSPWEVTEVQRRLAEKVVDLLSEPEVWMIDETSFPKAGDASVGVARQYCGSLGKVANCQVAVSLHWSTSEMSCPVSWRLYLPRDWVEDADRRDLGKIPATETYRSKTTLALELLDQALEWGLPHLPVVADSAYGDDFRFREALRTRNLQYAVSVRSCLKVWLEDPNKIPVPLSKPIGRRRRFVPLEAMPEPKDLRTVALELPRSAWRTITWRQGTQGPMRSRFAAVQAWASCGWKRQEHPDRVMEWLLIEWPLEAKEPTDYWLAKLGNKPVGIRRLVRTARARWRIEQDYREMKEELGLDHFEGRQWLGWHHHVTLVSMAFAFLRSEQARAKKNLWVDLADDSAPDAGEPDTSGRSLSMVPDGFQ